MSNVINIGKPKKQRKLSLWLIALSSTVLFIALSTIGLYAYQQKSAVPQRSIQNAQLEILKQQILQQDDVIDTNWLHTLNPMVKNVRGRLLWSSTKQQGLMEFSNLPKLSKNQKYYLWIYDLNTKTSDPISAVFAEKEKLKSKTLLIPFTASEIVNNPLRFELLLKEEGVDVDQHLLLAQP